jgi:hypothetical protein
MKKALFLLGFGLFLAVFATSCDSRRDIQAFYFPIKKMTSGKIYEFRPAKKLADSTASEFWYLRSERRGGAWFLITQLYGPDFSVGQNSVEKVYENGTVAEQILLYETDSAGFSRPIKTEIEAGNLFPFSVLDSTGAFVFRLRYRPKPTDSAMIYLIRNRRFRGDGQPFLWKKEAKKTIEFSLLEAIGSENEGAAEIEGRGHEVYADGLGLVFYEKNYGSGVRMAFQLVDTFSMQTLEKRAKRVFQNNGK